MLKAFFSFLENLIHYFVFVGPIGSILTNTIGCRLTTIIGAIIASIGFILSCFVDSIYLLYVTIGIICGKY